MLSPLLRVTFLFALPALTWGCSCLPESLTAEASLDRDDSVFRGVVLRKLKDTSDYLNYVVEVTKVFKGCNFNVTERVLVSTGSVLTNCEIVHTVNKTYVFSGYQTQISGIVQKQLGSKTRVKKAVELEFCGFNNPWNQVSRAESNALRAHDNGKCVAKCTTGVDCLGTHYCDAGACVALRPQCNTTTSLRACGAWPYSIATPCSETTAKCYAYWCGGWQSFYLDSNNTRVCM
jgi:hypothetical protein